MVTRINDVLTLRKEMWAVDFRGIPIITEERLRDGFGHMCERVSIVTTLGSLNWVHTFRL